MVNISGILFGEHLAHGKLVCWPEWKWSGTGGCDASLCYCGRVRVEVGGSEAWRMEGWKIQPGEGCMPECSPKASIQTWPTEVHHNSLWTSIQRPESGPRKHYRSLCLGAVSFSLFFWLSGKNASQKCWSAMLELLPTQKAAQGQMRLEWPLGNA